MSPPEMQITDPEIVTHRELATHANDIQHLQSDMDKLIVEVEEVKKSLQRIEERLAAEHAEDKLIGKIVTVLTAACGGLVVWALDRFFK